MSIVAGPRARRLAGRVGSTARGEPLLVVLGALVWVGVTALTGACFVWQVWMSRPLLLQTDFLGFVAAFAVSGAVCGTVAVAIYGRVRRACWLLLAFLAILAVAVGAMRWGVARLMGPSGPRFDRAWGRIVDSLGIGLALGGTAGLVAAGMVGLFALLTRRTLTWKSGLVLDAVLVVLGYWLLPQMIPWLAAWTWPLLQSHYVLDYERTIAGAGLGSLIGPVVLTLVAGSRGRRDESGGTDAKQDTMAGTPSGNDTM